MKTPVFHIMRYAGACQLGTPVVMCGARTSWGKVVKRAPCGVLKVCEKCLNIQEGENTSR